MTYKLHTLKKPTADRQADMDRLIGSNLIGIRWSKGDGGHESNFSVFYPAAKFGTHLFVHGRELFSPEAAKKYFAPGSDKSTFPYSEFSAEVRDKVKRLLSPEGLETRLWEYHTRDKGSNAVDVLQTEIKDIQEQYPNFIPPGLSAFRGQTDHQIRGRLMEAMEQQGLGPAQYMRHRHDQSGKDEQKLLEMRAAHNNLLLEDIDELLEELPSLQVRYGAHRVADPKQLRVQLLDYLKEHRHDPEILENFKVGLNDNVIASTGTRPITAEELIELGLNHRAEKAIRKMASRMGDPYAEKTTELEKRLARVVVQAVQPRVLQSMARKGTPLLLTNHNDVSIFSDIATDKADAYSGMYTHAESKGYNDFVLVAAPGWSQELLARVTRHECEHHQDISQQAPYALAYENKLDDIFARTRQHIAETVEFVKKTTPSSSEEDIARLRDLTAKWNPDYAHRALGLRETFIHDLEDIVEKTNRFLDDAAEHKHYPSKYERMQEVPAVVETLKGKYGTALIRELMPELYETVRNHRLQNPRLRNDPDKGMAR